MQGKFLVCMHVTNLGFAVFMFPKSDVKTAINCFFFGGNTILIRQSMKLVVSSIFGH